MKNQELDKLLERLHAELENADQVDEKGRELLRHLDEDIRALLGAAEPEQNPMVEIVRQLQESISYLEAKYPRVTAVLSDMVNSLSNAGI